MHIYKISPFGQDIKTFLSKLGYASKSVSEHPQQATGNGFNTALSARLAVSGCPTYKLNLLLKRFHLCPDDRRWSHDEGGGLRRCQRPHRLPQRAGTDWTYLFDGRRLFESYSPLLTQVNRKLFTNFKRLRHLVLGLRQN